MNVPLQYRTYEDYAGGLEAGGGVSFLYNMESQISIHTRMN